MAVLLVDAGHAAADDTAAVGQARVVTRHFLGADEVHSGVVLVKVIGHGLDLVFDAGEIRAFFRDNKALAGVLLTGREFGVLTLADAVDRRLHGNGVLAGIKDALDPADRVGMALAYALAPEGVVLALGQDAVHVQAVQGEHAGIPAAGDQADMTALLRSRIHVGEMSRDICVCVEAVHNIEQFRVFGGLDGKVSRAAAADHQDIDLVLHVRRRVLGKNRYTCRADLDRSGIAARKDGRQLQIIVLHDGAFNALGQVSVSEDSDLNAHFLLLADVCECCCILLCLSLHRIDALKCFNKKTV